MSIVRHSAWNMLSIAIPSILAIPIFGILSRLLGIEKFGLFTLIFSVVGYSTVFDVGLTRAVIRAVSLSKDDEEDLSRIMGTALSVIIILGMLVTLLLVIANTEIISYLNISTANIHDTEQAFIWVALCVPIVLLAQIYLAYLEGLEYFSLISIQKIITSSIAIVTPCFFLLYDNTLSSAVAGLLLGRVVILVVSYYYYHKNKHHQRDHFSFQKLKELISFGGWITLSIIISPIMVYFDRFLLSNVSGANQVAVYSGPAEIVSRLAFFPASIVRAVFPKMTRHSETQNNIRKSGNILLLITLGVLVTPFAIFANEILALWLGSSYKGSDSGVILQILLVGFVFNTLAQMPYTVLQAKGLSRVTALIHVSEIIPYLGILFWLANIYGPIGVAISWSVRVFVDYLILIICEKIFIKNI